MPNRFNFEKWGSKLDLFALKQNFRSSPDSSKLATPPGFIASLVMVIMGILFL